MNKAETVYNQKQLMADFIGKEYTKCHLDFADISNGGTLELFMSSTPNKAWGL